MAITVTIARLQLSLTLLAEAEEYLRQQVRYSDSIICTVFVIILLITKLPGTDSLYLKSLMEPLRV
jgi:hypothetical protein